MGTPPLLNLGAWRNLDGKGGGASLLLPANHLVTHACVVGMTGSGKTGCITVLVEEALSNRIPTIVIDVKGDLTNLLLAFPSFAPEQLVPWVEAPDGADDATELRLAEKLAEERRVALGKWKIDEAALRRYSNGIDVRVLTPGAMAGELLHVLSPLEQRSTRWDQDSESARQALSATISLLLRLLGRDPDPAKSREHVFLSVLAERRLVAGQNADLEALMEDVLTPPVAEIGALAVDAFIPKAERRRLAAGLNTLLASPTFASWRQGSALDVAEWVTPKNGRTPCVVVSVAHLDDEERALVLGILLEEVLSWVRSLRGSKRLRALLVFDEVYGFLPPHPANPPTKRPLVALMKQARGFGVGVVVATQNPMDLDYRALSNAGIWALGRLQTDADRQRVIEGLALAEGRHATTADLDSVLKRLASRWFVVQNAHAPTSPILMNPRYAISLLRGPMTRTEIRAALDQRAGRALAHHALRTVKEPARVVAELERPDHHRV